MKTTNRQLLSRASQKATSVSDFIHRLPSNFIINEYYFVIREAGRGVTIKAVLKNTGKSIQAVSTTDRSDDSMTVIAYNYPILVLRYDNILQC